MSGGERELTRQDLISGSLYECETIGLSAVDRELVIACAMSADLHLTSGLLQFKISDAVASAAGLRRTDAAIRMGVLAHRLSDGSSYIEWLGGFLFGFDPSYIKALLHSNLPEDCAVYVMDNGFHRKVGISNDPEKRLRQISTASSLPVSIVFRRTDSRKVCQEVESFVHSAEARYRLNGEWFDLPSHILISSINEAFKIKYDERIREELSLSEVTS